MYAQKLFGRVASVEVVEAKQLVERVSSSVEQHQEFSICLASGEEVLVSGKHKRFCDLSGAGIDALSVLACSSEVTLRPLADDEARTQKLQQHGKPLHDLLWSLSFLAGNSDLPNGYRDDDVISIKAWPNLTRLPGTPNIHRILALLTARPTSVRLARRILSVGEQEMHRAVSAAIHAGLAFSVNHHHPEPQLRKHRHYGLISLLMKRLTHNH